MEWMDELKQLMYSEKITFEVALIIHNIIYNYDLERAKTDAEKDLACEAYIDRGSQLARVTSERLAGPV